MLEFLRAGGVPMWVVLSLSSVSLVVAARFALAVDARKLAMLRALTWAQGFAVASSLAANTLSVLWTVGRDPELVANPVPALLVGFGEALTPAVLGLSALTASWILIAFGLRRAARSELEDYELPDDGDDGASGVGGAPGTPSTRAG